MLGTSNNDFHWWFRGTTKYTRPVSIGFHPTFTICGWPILKMLKTLFKKYSSQIPQSGQGGVQDSTLVLADYKHVIQCGQTIEPIAQGTKYAQWKTREFT